ncbi:MAG: hypothetical protein AAB074_20005 [Planctomycetota bacterium]
MVRSALVHVTLSLLCTALGLLAGWRIWKPGPAPAAAKTPPPGATAVSAQARKNLGIVIGEIKSTPWTRVARFPAVIESVPGSEATLKAPSSGTVVEVRTRAGSVIAAGASVATLRGAAGESITIPAPTGATDWDLVESRVAAGERVEAGAVIAVLRDARRMRVRAETGGDDAPVLVAALKDATACEATPLLPGNGPTLEEVTLVSVENEPGRRLTRASADVANVPLAAVADGAGNTVRTWALRPGQRYELRVPVEVVKRTYVVPADALADDGPDKVVFLPNGESFLPEKVTVLYRDSEVAVLDARTSRLAVGDPYVERGAPALSLALRAQSLVIGHTH